MAKLPKMIDGRTPEQLRADGDDRWPDGSRYTPPHLTGEERKRFEDRQDELDLLTPPANRCPCSFPHPPHDYCDGTPVQSRAAAATTEDRK